jgi:hypothetical protein
VCAASGREIFRLRNLAFRRKRSQWMGFLLHAVVHRGDVPHHPDDARVVGGKVGPVVYTWSGEKITS